VVVLLVVTVVEMEVVEIEVVVVEVVVGTRVVVVAGGMKHTCKPSRRQRWRVTILHRRLMRRVLLRSR
jgi:hypothetical protein